MGPLEPNHCRMFAVFVVVVVTLDLVEHSSVPFEREVRGSPVSLQHVSSM